MAYQFPPGHPNCPPSPVYNPPPDDDFVVLGKIGRKIWLGVVYFLAILAVCMLFRGACNCATAHADPLVRISPTDTDPATDLYRACTDQCLPRIQPCDPDDQSEAGCECQMRLCVDACECVLTYGRDWCLVNLPPTACP